MKLPKVPKRKSIKALRKQLEDTVALYVKLRDKHTCQKCGKQVEGKNCQASHVIPRSAGNQFRYDPINLKVLCFHCHFNWWHKNPVKACEWFKEKFPDRYEYLFGQPSQIVKLDREWYESQIEHYQQAVKIMEL